MSAVKVFVVSPDTRSERRYDLHTTVGQLKSKLELITGIPTANQSISVLQSEDNPQTLTQLDDDSKPLGFYSVQDWQVLKVDDTNPSMTYTGQLTDVSQVDKFEMTDEEYSSRRDTVLAYKQRTKMGRFAPKDEKKLEAKPTTTVDIPLGSRCEVESSEPGLSKRGTVRFVGPTKFGSGGSIWVGVEYDEPFGKNDGSVQGERYFECRPKYGVFVRPDKVKIGDYPVEDLTGDDEEI